MSRFQGMKPQRGLVALALLLLLAGLVSLAWSEAALQARAERHDPATEQALNEARAALLGYAASYPDRVNPQHGPGYLPCPAVNRRGVAAPGCGPLTQSTLGRFPWHTVRTNELSDGHGNPLWYAVSPSHRYNPKTVPLNSNTAGGISVDGEQAVAVVLAAGPPLAGQTDRHAESQLASQYLEALNSNSDVNRFTRAAPAPFNDRLVVLTGRQLSSVVERRVMGEFALRLGAWVSRHDGHYPWLLARSSSAGHLPGRGAERRGGRLAYLFVPPGSESAAAPSFISSLVARFQLERAVLELDDPAAALPAECLERSPCQLDGRTLVLDGTARCRWWTPSLEIAPRMIARCVAEQVFDTAQGRLEYRLRFALLDDDGDIAIRGPDAEQWRTREVLSSALGRRDDVPGLYLEIGLRLTAPNGDEAFAHLSVDEHTRGFFSAAAIRYPLDVNRGELPLWLVNNAWLGLIKLVWAPPDCVQLAACLTLVRDLRDGTRHTITRVRALLVGAGPPLPGQTQRYEHAPLSAWFEGNNPAALSQAQAFSARPHDRDFNDSIVIVRRLP